MRTKMSILVVLTTLSLMTFAQTKDSTLANQVYMHSWQASVKFDLPALDPEAIQVGLFEFDPIEKFTKNFDMTYLREQLKKAKDEKEKALYINSSIKVQWDNLFDIIKGSDLYLLTKNGFWLGTTSECSQPKTKKWFVSKLFLLDGKPYCYAVSLEIENGSKLEVTLDKTNLISLTDLYIKINK